MGSKLTAFVNCAIDFSQVYCVLVTATDFGEREAELLELKTIFPLAASIVLHGDEARLAWDYIRNSERFLVLGKHDKPAAIDMSRVCHVTRPDRRAVGTVTFFLGEERYTEVKINAVATQELLDAYDPIPRENANFSLRIHK